MRLCFLIFLHLSPQDTTGSDFGVGGIDAAAVTTFYQSSALVTALTVKVDSYRTSLSAATFFTYQNGFVFQVDTSTVSWVGRDTCLPMAHGCCNWILIMI